MARHRLQHRDQLAQRVDTPAVMAGAMRRDHGPPRGGGVEPPVRHPDRGGPHHAARPAHRQAEQGLLEAS